MASYSKVTDFAAKDTLPSGNPSKIVKGTEIDNEFDAIEVADGNNVKRDGTAALTANLPAGNFKITGLGAGTAVGDSLRWQQLFSQGSVVTVASAATVDIGAENSTFIEITGTTTITSLGTNYNGPRWLRFTGALILTHNATALNLPGSANITTEAGDTCVAIPNSSADGWNIVQYQRKDLAPGVADSATNATNVTGTIASAVTATTQTAGDNSTKVATTAYADRLGGSEIQPISASVGSSALTISASALNLYFRSTTLGSGAVTQVLGTPANLVISSGSTLGTIDATQSDIAVLAINNAGTIELAVCNLAGAFTLNESGLISTTAEGGAGAADSATTIYSTTARTNVAYRVLGYIRSTQATAGDWATNPSVIQGVGNFIFTKENKVVLETGTFSAAANLSLPLAQYAAYANLELEIYNASVSVDDSSISVRLSADNGATYTATSSYLTTLVVGLATSLALLDAATDQGIGNAAGESFHCTLKILNRTNSAKRTIIFSEVSYTNTNGDPKGRVSNGLIAVARANNGIRILPSSGTISGSYILRGWN